MHNPRLHGNHENVRVVAVGHGDQLGYNKVIRLNPDGSGWGPTFWVHSNNLKEVDFEEAKEEAHKAEFEALKKAHTEQLKVKDKRIEQLGMYCTEPSRFNKSSQAN